MFSLIVTKALSIINSWTNALAKSGKPNFEAILKLTAMDLVHTHKHTYIYIYIIIYMGDSIVGVQDIYKRFVTSWPPKNSQV